MDRLVDIEIMVFHEVKITLKQLLYVKVKRYGLAPYEVLAKF